MTIHKAARPTRSTRSTGRVSLALVALVLVPAAAGSLRFIELAGGPHLIPENARMTASPVPVAVHIVSAIPYAVLRHADVARHQAWMTRAYALALGAGTQVFRAAGEVRLS